MDNMIQKMKQVILYILFVSVMVIGFDQMVLAQSQSSSSSSSSSSMPPVPQPPNALQQPTAPQQPSAVSQPNSPGAISMPAGSPPIGVIEGNASVFFPTYFPYFASALNSYFPYFANSLNTYFPYFADSLHTYFPYFVNYLYTLAYEVQWFYEMAQADVTGSGPYDESITVTANSALQTGMATAATAAQKATSTGVTTAFSMNGVVLPAYQTSGMSVNGTDITGDNTVDNSQFSFDTLFAPIYYSTDNDSAQAKTAANVITYLSGSYIPLHVPTLSQNASIRANQLLLPDVQTYFLKLRTYTSEASVAISNLNYILQERTVQKGLGDQAGMTTLPTDTDTTQPIHDASPLQVQQFMVQRRSANSTWYTKMNASRNADLLREQLFVLAEIQAQLYQLHLDNERMMATASVGILALSAAGKATLAQQAQIVAQQIANNGGAP